MEQEEFRSFSNLLERIAHKYTKIENKPWDYGNGIVLTRPETQTLMAIQGEPGISVTELAKKRGVTKGAASQVVYKLAEKGLVDKVISVESDAQLNLYLSDIGEEEMRLHSEYHEKSSEPVAKCFGELSAEELKTLMATLKKVDEALEKRLNAER